MKTVTFNQDFNYGGIFFKKGEKLELPDDRAEMLAKIGCVGKKPDAKTES